MNETQLYLVPTPIGNIGDITFRAIEVLKEVDLILAEDTRTSGSLLKRYEISNRLESFHMHNEHKKVSTAVEYLRNGKKIALISDAGTPGISDPGYLLVRAALEQDIKLEVLPGATAFVPALVKSGFPCDRFVFEGFLPQKKGRQTRIKALQEEKRTVIFYESPHRIVKLLKELKELLPASRLVSVSRELSKMFEETITGTLGEVLIEFERREKIKGEFVVILKGHDV